jgi:Zn-dependent protease
MLGFLKQKVTIARVYNIPVRVDYRWFFVVVVFLWLSVESVPSNTKERIGTSVAWILGLLTTAAFFLSIFGHELAHALMARMEGIETEEIVLHPFGGLARMKREPDSPRTEFRIAIAGPAASFFFGLLFFCAMIIAGLFNADATATVFFLLFFGNCLLAVFNLFPGYPLDGGRVLRAFLWHRTGNINEATRTSGRCGQLIALALIAFGVFVAAWQRDMFTGLWTILVGLFLLDAASGVVISASSLSKATVADVMKPPITIEPEISISNFVDHILPLHRQTSFLVAQNKRLHGILTLEDLKALPRERWRQVKAKEVMRPVTEEFFVKASATMAHADKLMQHNGTNSLAVINGVGEIVGFLQRGRLKKK